MLFRSLPVRPSVSIKHIQSKSGIFYSYDLTRSYYSQILAPTYSCKIDAEPLHRYQPGGYHPLILGDFLNCGRYKIIHKLGWGSYSTTWAAKDEKYVQLDEFAHEKYGMADQHFAATQMVLDANRYVAIKISVADIEHSRELGVLQAISGLPKHERGSSRLNHMLDYFTLVGPNGSHDCLVLDLLGPSVADFVESYQKDDRLPAELAKSFSHQVLEGLDFLARHGIGHGDLHTRNLAIKLPELSGLDEQGFFDKLGRPETSAVRRVGGKALASNVPPHIVRPASFRKQDILAPSSSVKIIDFGEAFLNDTPPTILHTPLPVRAPEAIFGDTLDNRVDIWSAGCLIFELVAGQPPFDVMMLTPPRLVWQMLDFDRDGLPSRWQAQWEEMQKNPPCDNDQSYSLKEWLEEVYFDDYKHAEFTREDIACVSRLVERMWKLEPSARVTASDALADPWFNRP